MAAVHSDVSPQQPGGLVSPTAQAAAARRPDWRSAFTAEEVRQLEFDRVVGWSSLFMLGPFVARVWPHLALRDSLQYVVFGAPVVTLMWGVSSYFPRAYLRHRKQAMVVCRLTVLWLPVVVGVAAFDATIRQPVALPVGGPFLTAFMLFLATRTWLMVYSASASRLRLGWHLAVQTVNFVRLAVWARQPFCSSQLLASPPLQRVIRSVHELAALVAAILLPASPTVIPQSPGARCQALLLCVWALVGWLAPTVMLVPAKPWGEPHSRLERALGNLKSSAWQRGRAMWLLRWLLVLTSTWVGACLAAELLV